EQTVLPCEERLGRDALGRLLRRRLRRGRSLVLRHRPPAAQFVPGQGSRQVEPPDRRRRGYPSRANSSRSTAPVAVFFAAIWRGVPLATMRPPPAPPSGPSSTTWSADAITAGWCS